MLEGFRPGRVVRVFGSGWKIRNQNFQECLINYGYNARQVPDFRECSAKHYPEQFPYRTDYGNRHLDWFQPQVGTAPPMYAEHVVCGELTKVAVDGRGGEFRLEPTGEAVSFTMLETGARRNEIYSRSDDIEGVGVKLADLMPGRRYRFSMFQDERKSFTRCSAICDDYSRATLNSLNYRIRNLDLKHGWIEVDWQGEPVRNYQKDLETPPPYGRSRLTLSSATRIWKGADATETTALAVDGLIKFNSAAELPGRPSYCTDIWIVEPRTGKEKRTR